MEQRRVVRVAGGGGPGSGFVLHGRLVLTSAHVVGDTDRVEVFRPGEDGVWPARVVWRGVPGGRDDAALVLVADAAGGGRAFAGVPVRPVRWGRLVTSVPGTPGETWGLPDLVQRPGCAVELMQVSGTLNPGDRQIGNRYVLAIGQHPPGEPAGGSSPWGGMSGAALLCDGLLAGVVTVDPAGRAHAALEAVPAYVLLHDPAFRAALAEHAPEVGTVEEPVEWQGLQEPAEPAGPVRSPAALLRARRQVAPFRGRTALLAELQEWAAPAGFDAALVHGPGGQGKTRLAQQLANVLAAQRWAVVWLSSDAGAAPIEALAGTAVPTLVVIDYAETRTAHVRAVVRAAAKADPAVPFKVLMLARVAGDWVAGLRSDDPAVEELLEGVRATKLPPLTAELGTEGAEAYEEAVAAYAGALPGVRGWSPYDWPALAAEVTAAGSPAAASSTVLTVHMTALADLLDAAQQGPASGGRTVEDRLLVHEERWWKSTATAPGLTPALSMGTLKDALAAAFLLGAEDHGEADALLRRVPRLADQPADRVHAVRTWIAALYPPASTRPWDGLQPDRLAEHFLGRHLHDPDGPALLHSLTPDATPDQAAQLVTVLTRTAANPHFRDALAPSLTELCVQHPAILGPHAVDAATQTNHPQPLLTALHHITDNPDTPLNALHTLADRTPLTSHNLADWAAHHTQRLVQHHRQDADSDPADLATSLNNRSVRLADLGRREEALEAISEAVDLHRALAEEGPDAFLPNLASSLNNHANRLAGLGRREEGLEAISEAVRIRRALARDRPEAFLPDLASSLNNHAIRLAGLGRREEALEVISEAVHIRRALAEARPQVYHEVYEQSLSTLQSTSPPLPRGRQPSRTRAPPGRGRAAALDWPGACAAASATRCAIRRGRTSGRGLRPAAASTQSSIRTR